LADIVPSVTHPFTYFETNVTGTAVVLEAAKAASVNRLVYAASSSCYGMPDHFPTPETSAIKPEYPYALTKWMGEELICHWGAVYGLEFNSLRLFNVFGPRARTSGTYGAVFGVFLAQKLAEKPLTIVGDGSQTRDFTYVSDVVRAFVLAGESVVHGEVFNVGSGGTYSIADLAIMIGGDTVNIPVRPGEPEMTFADTSKIQQTLGWSPEISFVEGVGKTLEVIKDWSDSPVWDPESIAEATQIWFKHLQRKDFSN
jgi:UDP-glucose 4-epimerase